MSDEPIIAMADDVAELLNAATFSRTFTAERTYLAAANVEDLAELHVWVVPKSTESAPRSRATNEDLHAVDVAIQQQAPTDAERDALLGLAGEIKRYLDRRRLPTVSRARWVEATTAPLWDPKDLHERHVFTAVVTATYRMESEAGG